MTKPVRNPAEPARTARERSEKTSREAGVERRRRNAMEGPAGGQDGGLPVVPAVNGVTVNSLSQTVISPGTSSDAVLPGG